MTKPAVVPTEFPVDVRVATAALAFLWGDMALGQPLVERFYPITEMDERQAVVFFVIENRQSSLPIVHAHSAGWMLMQSM